MPRTTPAFIEYAGFLLVVAILLQPPVACGQEKSPFDPNKPEELIVADPQIRAMLASSGSSCGQSSINEAANLLQQALKIAETGKLTRDRAIVEARLASVFVSQAQLESASATFQKALQDAIESKNGVLEADILISLASEAQVKGNIPQATELDSRALTIADKVGSLYERSQALGELGKIMLVQGETDKGAASIDEALQIDKLNGYNFEAIHLEYRAIYLGLEKHTDDAIATAAQAITKSLAIGNAYSFLLAVSTHAYGLIQNGNAEEAIGDLALLRQHDLQKFTKNVKEQACMTSALDVPIFRITVLEYSANAFAAVNQKEKELEIWHEIYDYSDEHTILAGEAEAAHKVGNLASALKRTDDALKYYEIASDLYRKLHDDSLLAQVLLSRSVLLMQAGRPKEAIPFELELTAYAKSHNLRETEFTAYGVLAEIYQPAGDLANARDALEKALSLVRPAPFDDVLNNRFVLEDYLRLADVYRALKVPTLELVAVDKAFVVALHLKDEKEQQRIVAYLDQRLKDLGIRDLVAQRQKDGQLVESLLYACILYTRDGSPKPGEDSSNYDRILSLPFQITQTSGGAKALSEVLDEVDSFLGVMRIALIDPLARYYITSGNDPVLAEKYALRSEEIIDTLSGDVTAEKAQIACVLAISYSHQFKTALAKAKLTECSELARKANDKQSLAFAAAADAMVFAGTADPASATDTLERLLAKVPDNPEFRLELAVSLANSKLYDRAASQLALAVVGLNSKGDKKAVGEAYERIASALNDDDSPKARELQLQYLLAGEQSYHELDTVTEESGALNALGNYYLKVSQADDAISYFRRAQDLAQKVGRKDVLAWTLLGLGNAYQTQKDFAQARDFHSGAAEVYRELKLPGLEVTCLDKVAADYTGLNEPDESLSKLLEARAVASEATPLTQFFALFDLADFYRDQGQFEASLVTFREAAEITQKAGDVEHCATSHLNMAQLESLIGTGEEAINEARTALSLYERIGNRQGQASSWAELTVIYSDRTSSVKNFGKAQECFAKAEAFGYGEILQLDYMEMYIQTGKYLEAEQIAKDSVKRCTKDGNADCQAHALVSLAEAQRLHGEIEAARSSLNEARPLASKSHDFYLRGRILYAESGQLVSEHKPDEALASYKSLISLIETLKGQLDAKEQKSLSENYGFIYDELVSLLYSMSKADPNGPLRYASSSLEYAEINKARQFADSWGRTFIIQMQKSLPASVQETERSLISKRDSIVAQLNGPASSVAPIGKNEKDGLQTRLAGVQTEIAAFVGELRIKSPQYAAVAYPETIQVSTLPLKMGETLIEFKMTNDSTFVWIVENPTGNRNELISFYNVPQNRSWFLDRISLLRRLLNSGHPETIDWTTSEEIFAALFPGQVSQIISASQNIVFIPDDVLFALPFDLYSPNASKQKFVFLDKPTVYYPSAASFRLARLASRHSGWQEAFLGLADPITSPEDDRYEDVKATHDVFALSVGRHSDSTEPMDRTIGPDSLKARGYMFDRLPGTAIEVRDIASLFKQANEKVDVRLGMDATKNRLLDTDLSKYRFLHFATHGVLPVDTEIQEPALVLSSDGLAPAHMFLSMSEILGLTLQSESVVLSACNTGSGDISRAEGVMSLGRAFLAAGSSSVTVSLWQVSDDSTTKLMEKYYQGILAGKAKSVALSESREALFLAGYKDPYFWAPFILIGE